MHPPHRPPSLRTPHLRCRPRLPLITLDIRVNRVYLPRSPLCTMMYLRRTIPRFSRPPTRSTWRSWLRRRTRPPRLSSPSLGSRRNSLPSSRGIRSPTGKTPQRFTRRQPLCASARPVPPPHHRKTSHICFHHLPPAIPCSPSADQYTSLPKTRASVNLRTSPTGPEPHPSHGIRSRRTHSVRPWIAEACAYGPPIVPAFAQPC